MKVRVIGVEHWEHGIVNTKLNYSLIKVRKSVKGRRERERERERQGGRKWLTLLAPPWLCIYLLNSH